MEPVDFPSKVTTLELMAIGVGDAIDPKDKHSLIFLLLGPDGSAYSLGITSKITDELEKVINAHNAQNGAKK